MAKQLSLVVSDNFDKLLTRMSDKYGMSPISYISHLLLIQDVLRFPIIKPSEVEFNNPHTRNFMLKEGIIKLLKKQAERQNLNINEYIYYLLIMAEQSIEYSEVF